ncbi:MAG: S24 family peptidase [Citrobacter sp.]
MDMYEHRRKALQALVDSIGRGGIASIAQKIGKDASYVSRMLYSPEKSGSKRIGEDSAMLLLNAYPSFFTEANSLFAPGVAAASTLPPSAPVGVPVFPREQPASGYVRLQHLSPQPSMGPGAELCEPVQLVRHLDVLESWVRQKVGSASYDRIKILTGCGQSMRPTIQDQDLVFVDIGQRTIDIPGIYVLDVCGRFLLKRAMILSDGTLVLRSDNTAEFPDEERIDLSKAAESVNVAGRVKAWWTLQQG